MQPRWFEIRGSFCCLVEGQMVCLDLQNDGYFGLSREDTDRLFGQELSDAELLHVIEELRSAAASDIASAQRSGAHAHVIADRIFSGLVWLGCHARFQWLQVLIAQIVAAARIHAQDIGCFLVHCRLPSSDDSIDSITPNIKQLAANYSRLSRWSPLRGECLFHSVAVHLFLSMNHLCCEITFGVRAQPFAAHCWIRGIGNAAFGDLEDITTFERIMQAQVRT